MPLIQCFEGIFVPICYRTHQRLICGRPKTFNVLSWFNHICWHWGEDGVDSDPSFELSARHQFSELV